MENETLQPSGVTQHSVGSSENKSGIGLGEKDKLQENLNKLSLHGPENAKGESEEEKMQGGKLDWNDQTEKLLANWADLGACYKWLHEESFRSLSKTNTWYSLPVIILSTIAGALNLSLQSYVPSEYMSYSQAGIGAINIFTGILTTLQTKFRYAERSEAHNNISVGWSKFQRDISIELSVAREHRKEADTFIRIKRNEYDRLLENSPVISEEIIEKFKVVFNKQQKELESRKVKLIKKAKSTIPKKSFFQKGFSNRDVLNTTDNSQNINDIVLNIDNEEDKLVVPDICGNIAHTKVYREPKRENQRNLLNFKSQSVSEVENDEEKSFIDPNTRLREKEIFESRNPQSGDGSRIRGGSVLDRIKELDEKISGVNQYKIALAGQRLAPLASLIAESERYNLHKDTHHLYRDRPFGTQSASRDDTDYRRHEGTANRINNVNRKSFLAYNGNTQDKKIPNSEARIKSQSIYSDFHNIETRDSGVVPGFIETSEGVNTNSGIDIYSQSANKSINYPSNSDHWSVARPTSSNIDIANIIRGVSLPGLNRKDNKDNKAFISEIKDIPRGKVKNLIGKFGDKPNMEIYKVEPTSSGRIFDPNSTAFEELTHEKNLDTQIIDIENQLSKLENQLIPLEKKYEETIEVINPLAAPLSKGELSGTIAAKQLRASEQSEFPVSPIIPQLENLQEINVQLNKTPKIEPIKGILGTQNSEIINEISNQEFLLPHMELRSDTGHEVIDPVIIKTQPNTPR